MTFSLIISLLFSKLITPLTCYSLITVLCKFSAFLCIVVKRPVFTTSLQNCEWRGDYFRAVLTNTACCVFQTCFLRQTGGIRQLCRPQHLGCAQLLLQYTTQMARPPVNLVHFLSTVTAMHKDTSITAPWATAIKSNAF